MYQLIVFRYIAILYCYANCVNSVLSMYEISGIHNGYLWLMPLASQYLLLVLCNVQA